MRFRSSFADIAANIAKLVIQQDNGSLATASRDAVAHLLSSVRARGTFAAQRTATADDLRVEVKGLGRLRFPISRDQAQRLCGIARPARYGRGKETLLDRRVRDAWEVRRGGPQGAAGSRSCS